MTSEKPRKRQTEFARVMKQLRKNKVAMFGLAVLLVEFVLALLAELFFGAILSSFLRMR